MNITHYRDSWPRGTFPGFQQWLADSPREALFEGLAGSADAWLIAELYTAQPRTVLVCVDGPKRAETLAEECRTFLPPEAVRLFPSRDAVPYNMKSPFGPTVEARLALLSALLAGGPLVVIAPHAALLQKAPPPQALFNATIRLHTGMTVAIEQLSAWLQEAGFRRETKVEDVGTYAVRGGVVDIYPYNTEHPLRAEFFGDTLESLRRFSVFSQKSVGPCEAADVLPMREFPLGPAQVAAGIERMLSWGKGSRADMSALHGLEHQWGRAGDLEGIEWYSHWFDMPSALFTEYLPESALVVWDDLFGPERRFGDVLENYRRHLERVPAALRSAVSQPEQLLADPAAVMERLGRLRRVYAATADAPAGAARYACGLAEQPALSRRIETLAEDLAGRHAQGLQVTVLSPTPGHSERLLELVGERCPFVSVAIGYLREGYVDQAGGRAIYTDNQLFPYQPRPQRGRRYAPGEAIAHYDELEPGDFVVHVDHGIGRFAGIERTAVGAGAQDCMVLEYAERAKLYVPLDDFRKVQKYTGREGYEPPLSALGSGMWERTKRRTRESLKSMAADLVELYAKRQYLEGIAFGPDTVWQKEFEEAFLYEETPDQARAIADVKADMEARKPMDRLVCGDVGFGKTEVAMRAAFKAVMAGRQVAVLAPTTILVAQHYETFRERMASFPVRVAMLSRFLSPAEQKAVIAQVREGAVDILIGTHRALSADVTFKNLGLLVIDEEQRFGVRHKERLKQYRFEVDVLSMTATPIPRTLHMSLIGARDLSIIATPPRDRLPIDTRVAEYHDELLARALADELERGGQVYLVDNRISHLAGLAEKVEALAPRARVAVAHGRMDEGELARIMREFVAGRFDVLIATTIIENGLDIPNVNTIVVNRADLLGLSQLYQLRGRVGRSAEQAYAWLLVPSFKSVSETALRRLRVLEQYTDLGSGFPIAMRDLEIRGAGDILGTQQHGAIAAVGFEMYCRLLREAMDEIMGRQSAAEESPVKMDVECDAYLPVEYVPDAATRVTLYRELSAAGSAADVAALRLSLADRFGPLPPSVHTLLLLVELRLAVQALGCRRVGIGRDGVLSVHVSGDPGQVRAALERAIRQGGGRFEVVYGEPVRLRARLAAGDTAGRLAEAVALLGMAGKSGG